MNDDFIETALRNAHDEGSPLDSIDVYLTEPQIRMLIPVIRVLLDERVAGVRALCDEFDTLARFLEDDGWVFDASIPVSDLRAALDDA